MSGYLDESVGMKWIDGRFLINRKTGEMFPFEENIAANPVFAECNERGDIIDGKSPVYEPDPEPEDPINIDQIDALLTLKYEAEDELEIANIHLNNLSRADKDFSDDRYKDNERIRELEDRLEKLNDVLEPGIPDENESSITTSDFNRLLGELYDSEFHGKAPTIQNSKPRFIPIKECTRKDDWYLAIRDAAKLFEEENGYTPDKTKLWLWLINSPPSDYVIKYDKESEALSMSGNRPLDRENFTKRYDRYYPNNPQ